MNTQIKNNNYVLNGQQFFIDRDTQTILFARHLARKHPEILQKIFCNAKTERMEILFKSINRVCVARAVILEADLRGLI